MVPNNSGLKGMSSKSSKPVRLMLQNNFQLSLKEILLENVENLQVIVADLANIAVGTSVISMIIVIVIIVIIASLKHTLSRERLWTMFSDRRPHASEQSVIALEHQRIYCRIHKKPNYIKTHSMHRFWIIVIELLQVSRDGSL